jgi:hypothetical protein
VKQLGLAEETKAFNTVTAVNGASMYAYSTYALTV